MSTKSADKDEVALLMQQQGLSRVQATKMLYEMAKQKKKEEAAGAATAARSTVLNGKATQEDTSVVKKHIERYSSLKDVTAPVPSAIHEDIDLTTPRPTYKLEGGTSFRYAADGASTVNVMAASLESKSSKNKEAQGRTVREDDDDDDDTEEVYAVDVEKLSDMALVEESPTAVAGGTNLASPPARRRSSNSALNLRPLARLHPDKFQQDGSAPTFADSDTEPAAAEMDYQSGNSSDAEGWEEPAAPEVKSVPKPSPAPVPAPVAPVLKPPAPVLAAVPTKPVPTLRPPEAPRTVSPVPSLASKLLPSLPDGEAPKVAAPTVPTFSKVKPMSIREEPGSESSSGKSETPAAVASVTTATATSSSSTSTLSESKTVTQSYTSSSMRPPPAAAAPQLQLEEKMALLNSGKSSTPPASARGAAEATGPVPMNLGATAAAADVMNIKLGSKKLTVRASFTNGSAGSSIPPSLAAASAAAAGPPPPPYAAAEPPPPAYDVTARPIPPVPAAASKPTTMKAPAAPAPPAAAAAEEPSPLTPTRTESYLTSEGTQLSDVAEDDHEDESEAEEGLTHEERVAAMMTRYRRRSRMKRDSLPAAFKNLSPIDEAEIGRLMHQEQKEKEAAAAAASAKAQSAHGSTSTSAQTTTVSSASSSGLQIAVDHTKPEAQEVAAVLTKTSTDLVEELISQGYSRENALELAKEIELDRRGERYRPRHLAENSPSGPHVPRRSMTSVTSHTSSVNNYREHSFDRGSSFNDEDGGSVISNISGVSRASSYCESDKLLMNLLLSQQKGKYGVNMYESLTNHDEPAIERYMSRGCTLDQAVLKVFEKKYGSVENQVLPKSVYPGHSTGAGKLALTGEDPLEIVDTMHAEIELLMLSGGYTRDVAVKMLLSKVAKERALQQQQGGIASGDGEHHLHKAASMSAMLPGHHQTDQDSRSVTSSHGQSSHTHSLHATRSMYAMPSSGSSVTSGDGRRPHPGQYGSSTAPPLSPHEFPTQYPPHSSGGHHSSRHRTTSDEWAAQQQRRRPSGSAMSVVSQGIASVNSASGRMSLNTSGSAGSRTQDDREFMPALLREQEAMFGINMYDYLAPDDPEVARLMAQFGFSKTDAMIAVFRQFPPPALSPSSRPPQGQRRDARGPPPPDPRGPPPGHSRSAPSSSNHHPGPSASSHYGRTGPPAVSAIVNQEEDDLQRALRLSVLEQANNPGAVVVPGVGGGGPPLQHQHRTAGGPPPSNASFRQPSNHDVTTLMHMGFTSAQAHDALRRHNGDVQLAANYLVGGH